MPFYFENLYRNQNFPRKIDVSRAKFVREKSFCTRWRKNLHTKHGSYESQSTRILVPKNRMEHAWKKSVAPIRILARKIVPRNLSITENFPPPNRRFWRIPKILHHRKFLLLQYTDWIHGDSTWSVVYATRDCGLDSLAPSMGQSSDAICEHVCIALAPKAVRATVTGSPGLNPHY